MIIGLSGKMQAGKNTVGMFLSLAADLHGLEAWQFAFADALKDAACDYGWCGEKDPRGRFLLQTIGQERRRQKLDWWVEALDVTLSEEAADVNIITDVRHRNEADWIREKGGEVWRILRLGYERAPDDKKNQHLSETELDSYEFDAVISAADGNFDVLYSRAKEEFQRLCEAMTGSQ